MKQIKSKDKCIIKNKGKGFKMVIATALAAVGMLTSFTGCTESKTDLSTYASNSQIVNVAKQLDCDMSYVSQVANKYTKMQHNGDEPVYVCFDEKMNKKETTCAQKALDYTFGIVGKINDFYKYQLVDEPTFDSKGLKTKIYFTVTDSTNEDDPNATARNITNPFSLITSTETDFYFKVLKYRKEDEETAEKLEHTYIHELLHVFGFDDVYKENTLKHMGNTYMKSGVNGMITPNDFKCLISLYAPKFESESEEKEAIVHYKQMIEDYETYYYDKLSDIAKARYKNFSQQINILEKSFTWYGERIVQGPNDFKFINYYELKVENKKYTFKIFDSNKKEIDTHSGEAVHCNGVIFLKDVELKEGISPSTTGSPCGFIQDMCLLQLSAETVLVDLIGEKSVSGQIYQEIENEIDL